MTINQTYHMPGRNGPQPSGALSGDAFSGHWNRLACMLMATITALCQLIIWWGPAHAGTAFDLTATYEMHNQCDAAAIAAARATGVPRDILRALALTESGRTDRGRFSAWPWTLNANGKGYWYDTRAAALTAARARQDAGAHNFDVGCFQINYRWHGHAFASLDEMFSPSRNAMYAAGFLASLEAELGSWNAAVGAYHSRTPELAAAYLGRFRERLSSLAQAPEPDHGPRIANTDMAAAAPAATRAARRSYPLLGPGAAGRLGSLLPAGASAGTGRFLRSKGRALQ